MSRLRAILGGLAASLLLALPVQASTIPLMTGPLDPSNLLSYFNNLIVSINTAVTPATAGTGNISAAINTPAVANAVNALQVTPGATTVGVMLSVGDSFGQSSDANIGITLAGKGTGAAHLGGTTLANGSLRVPTVASAVNQFQISGAITTAEPIATVGGTASDSNIGIVIAGKGTGSACLGGTTCATASFAAPTVASAVNHLISTGSATGVVPSLGVGGSGADTNVDFNVKAAGTGIVTLGQARATCTGTTTATCQGQRFIVSITGLTTAAAGTESAAMTVTNASVVAATSIVHCQVNIYAGTGNPIATRVTPGTGSVSMTVTNVAGSGSLNATVPVACVVF